MPRWKRALLPLGWDTIFLLAMVPVIVTAVVMAVLVTGLLAVLASPLHLDGAPAAILGVVLVATFLGLLIGIPILMARRVRRAFPPELFPDPDAHGAGPPRRSATDIRADVARFDAALATTTPPPPDAYDDRGGRSAASPPASTAAGPRSPSRP